MIHTTMSSSTCRKHACACQPLAANHHSAIDIGHALAGCDQGGTKVVYHTVDCTPITCVKIDLLPPWL